MAIMEFHRFVEFGLTHDELVGRDPEGFTQEVEICDVTRDGLRTR
jgi:hypothetical protein